MRNFDTILEELDKIGGVKGLLDSAEKMKNSVLSTEEQEIPKEHHAVVSNLKKQVDQGFKDLKDGKISPEEMMSKLRANFQK